jgi:proteasome lid subunit RPN8/RPN11
MRSNLICNWKILNQTLSILREGGKLNCETVALWLGIEDKNTYRVVEAYRPQQEVDVDYFRLSSASMRELMKYLRKNRTRVVAQVHSHPKRAFHSVADDKWAILRHEGAISIVVPYFAQGVDERTFPARVATFQLSTEDKWIPVNFRSAVTIVP